MCVLFISDIEDSGSNVHIKTTVTAGQHVPPVAILKRKHIETETHMTLCLFCQTYKLGDEQYTDTLDRNKALCHHGEQTSDILHVSPATASGRLSRSFLSSCNPELCIFCQNDDDMINHHNISTTSLSIKILSLVM